MDRVAAIRVGREGKEERKLETRTYALGATNLVPQLYNTFEITAQVVITE